MKGDKIKFQKLAEKMKEKQIWKQTVENGLKRREEKRKEEVTDFEKKGKVIVSYCESINEVFEAVGIKERLIIEIQPDSIDKIFKRYYFIYFTQREVNYNTPFLSFELRTFNGELEINRYIPYEYSLSLDEVKFAQMMGDPHYEGYIRNFVEACTGYKL